MGNETFIRVGSFLTVFILIALWEIVARRRSLTTSKKGRWFSNLGIILINTLLVRLVFPVLAVNMAISARQSGWGLLNNLDLPWWDRLFGTYCDQPAKGHDGMTIGFSQFRDPKKLTLPWLLLLPFIGDPGKQSINRY